MTRATTLILMAGLVGIGGLSTSRWLASGEKSTAPDFDTLHQGLEISDFLRAEIEAQGGTRIAILVPYEMTSDAETAAEYGLQLKIALSGYTAVLGDGALDYVINGASHHGDEPEDDYMMPYEDFDDGRGGSLSFGFRGADYQVELYCLAENPDPETNCLDHEQVEGFVNSLMGQ